jgi:hypothetical protein
MAYQPQTLTNFKYQPHPDMAGAGLLAFAGGAVLLLGLLNLFYAIAVIAGSHIFITHAAWLLGDARPWGWFMLIVALVQLSAPVSIWLGGRWGQWVGILSGVSNIGAQAMFLSDVPAVAILLILVDVGVIHTLVVYGGGRPLTGYLAGQS